MRKFFQQILARPIRWLAGRLSSAPVREEVFNSLTSLQQAISSGETDRGITISFPLDQGRFIFFSDHHRGGKDGADDFYPAESTYMSALAYYYKNEFSFINLGDSEELWENTPPKVVEKNRLSLLEEAKFLQKDRYYRIYGNHDLEWKYAIQQNLYLKPIFGKNLKIYEGITLTTLYNDISYSFLLTHGHQGDRKSDGNAFSMWFVAAIWTPVQRFLKITVNTVADSFDLVDQHNILMYEWSETQKNTILISGHTHKPVFASLDHIDRLTKKLLQARASNNSIAAERIEKQIETRQLEYAGKTMVRKMAHPTYFNTGCCCFNDGDITGIEICDGNIRLVKWKRDGQRYILEESSLAYLFDKII